MQLNEDSPKELASSLFSKHHECPSCLEKYQVGEMTGLSCQHLYCNDCFKKYLFIQINEGAGRVSIKCPTLKCKFVVDQLVLISHLETKSYQKWLSFVVNDYVVDLGSNRVKWCPTKGNQIIPENQNFVYEYKKRRLHFCDFVK